MSLRRNLPVPIKQARTYLRRGLLAFIRPYLLLILGSAILLSFVVAGADRSPGDNEAVEVLRPGEPLVDGPPASNTPPGAPNIAPVIPTQSSATVVDPTQTVTPPPTATTTPPTAAATATPVPSPTSAPTPDIPDLNITTNILLLGSDQRVDRPNWRTDVVILLLMNPYLGEAAIVSFPRDMYIDSIPGHLPNRINVIDYLGEMDAPGGGGPKLLISILEERLGIFIDHYVRFRFDGFVSVIDALGGLRIYVDCYLYEYYPEEGIYLNLPPGEHLLTGQQALSYVRSRRSGGGDLERARRQQRVVWALRKQLADQNFVQQALLLRQLFDDLRYSVDTDIGVWDALKAARFGLTLNDSNVKGMVLSTPDALTPGWRQDMSVFIVDWEFVAGEIIRVFDRPPLVETNTALSPNRPQPDDAGAGGVSALSRPECP